MNSPIDGRLYEMLEPMWHNPLDYNFETAADMAEMEKSIRIAGNGSDSLPYIKTGCWLFAPGTFFTYIMAPGSAPAPGSEH